MSGGTIIQPTYQKGYDAGLRTSRPSYRMAALEYFTRHSFTEAPIAEYLRGWDAAQKTKPTKRGD